MYGAQAAGPALTADIKELIAGVRAGAFVVLIMKVTGESLFVERAVERFAGSLADGHQQLISLLPAGEARVVVYRLGEKILCISWTPTGCGLKQKSVCKAAIRSVSSETHPSRVYEAENIHQISFQVVSS
eukprot:c25299_g1_i1.p2 GENE.c25299_g1_i1~~c25299_g1_i1.p2  ORF type:complete len:130 (+),score=19.11 c25299_g1_i1:46-435(+)